MRRWFVVSHEKSEATFSESAEDSAERRQARYGVDVNVTINSEHHFLAGSAMNLSSGGIFIATHIVHPIGTKFNLSIHLDDGDPGVVRGVGEVRWQRAREHGEGPEVQGLGIKFIEIAGNGEERIKRFLAQREPERMPSEPP
jgi:uncharacterized protein (TIGR02266 family)